MLTGPDYIQFYPTTRCDRACGFCFNRGMPQLPDMPIADFRRMLGVLRNTGTRTIDVMGGEPTLHPHLPDMVRLAEDAGFSVNISSNGRDLGMLGRIMGSSANTTVGLSVNDRNSLERLAPFIRARAPVVKTVYRTDLEPSLVTDILSLRPNSYFLLYPDAMGPVSTNGDVPFHEFVQAIRRQYPVHAVGAVFCSGFLPDTDRYPQLATVRCPAGTTKLGILPDGSVFPCNLFFGIPSQRLGNILGQPFDTVWADPKLDFFRSVSRNTCTQDACGIRHDCRGGCPAHALLHHGDLSATDVRCVIVR